MWWTVNCGCNTPSNAYIEFPIHSIKKEDSNSSVVLSINSDHTDDLKNRVLCEYYEIIEKLECGIQEDLKLLMEELSLLEIRKDSSDIIYGNSNKLETTHEELMITYTTFFGSSPNEQIPDLSELKRVNEFEFRDNIDDVYYFIITPYKLDIVETPFESLLDETNPSRFIKISNTKIRDLDYEVWRFSLNSGLVFDLSIEVTLKK